MKKRTIKLVLITVLALLLLLPAGMIPVFGDSTSANVTVYKTPDFDDLTLGLKGHDALVGTFAGNHANNAIYKLPSSTTVVEDPVPSHEGDQAIQISLAPASTGTKTEQDFVLFNNRICYITWNENPTTNSLGQKVYQGYFTDTKNSTTIQNQYGIQSTDNKETALVVDVSTNNTTDATPQYAITSDAITYGGASCAITWDASTTKDLFGNDAYFGYFVSGSAAFRVKSTDNKANCVIIPKNATYNVSNDAAVVEAVKGGENIYRSLLLGHDAVSYADAGKVVLQTEYYIPSGGKGCFWVQQSSFKYFFQNSSNTAEQKKSWLNYYTIDVGSGVMTVQAFTTDNGSKTRIPLEKDTWVTISLAIDLVNGTMDIYINNILKDSGSFFVTVKENEKDVKYNIKNITLDTNSWQLAKIDLNQGYADNLRGEFYIDNAVIHQYDDNQKVVFSESDATAIGVAMTLASGRECGAALTDTVLVNPGMTAKPIYLTSDLTDGVISSVKAASIRLTSAGGIRFGTQVNTEKMNVLQKMKESGQIKDLQIGTLITPAEYVIEAGGFTKEALDKLSYSAKYLDVKGTVGAYFPNQWVTMEEGYDALFVGSILNIKPANLTRSFAGIGYIKITALDGTEYYYYSYEYDAAKFQTDYARNLSTVAGNFIGVPGYEDYQDVLKGFQNGLTVPSDIPETTIKNVQYTVNNFFFQNTDGISMRLSYEGESGWRFQAVDPTNDAKPYSYFSNNGAGQALALYLGEYCGDETKPIVVTKENGYIRILEKVTGSYVDIATTGDFNVQFYDPNGEAMNNINGVAVSKSDGLDQITLTGALYDKAEEAIFGGGQRFDSANKRDLSLSLFTYDAYNTDGGNGTYTVIPLFLSTRGSGLFINRYERMVVDFDKTATNQWTVTLTNKLMDCYVYATGDMTDALNGYANISGYATMPEEWAQGTLVCRYNPDFASLDGTAVIYEKLSDIPGYEDLFTGTYSGASTTRAMTATTITKGTYLYKGTTRSYYYDGTCFYGLTKKGNPAGYGVRQIVESLMDAGMKPDAIIIEALEAAWMNSSTENTNAKQNLQKIKEIADWLHSQDIKLMLYMSIAEMSVNMEGIKDEYYVRADITIDVDETVSVSHGYKDSNTPNTERIPWSATSSNPDAIGASDSFTYLDITNPEAVDWYMNHIWGMLIDIGVDGCKIDFCEMMPNGVTPLKVKGDEGYVQVGTVTVDYHWYDPSIFSDGDVHHAYPTYFETIFYQSMIKQKEEKKISDGFNLLSRGGGIGVQRNPSMWGGDQVRNEASLSVQLLTLMNSGLSGIPFISYDMAGYAYDTERGGYFGNSTSLGDTPEKVSSTEAVIYLRAIQYTAFTTMIQTHGDVRNVYDMELIGNYPDNYVQTVSERYVGLRESLQSYIRKWSEVSCTTGMPLVRHLALQYQDDANTWNIDDQFMLGDAIMVAPVLELYNYRRDIYLPQGKWQNMLTGEVYTVGAEGLTLEDVGARLDQISVFLNMESEDYDRLIEEVFNGEDWQAINGGYLFGVVSVPESTPENDPFKEDPFGATASEQ